MDTVVFDVEFPEPARLRAETGMSQTELAALIGTARYQTWQSWELGSRAMPHAAWVLVLLMTDRHPTLRLAAR